MKLTTKQTIALDHLEDNETTELGYGGAAGGGKSILGTYWLAKNCLKYPETRYLMGRAIGKTLKETTLVSFFKMATMQGLKAGVHFEYKEQKGIIKFPTTGSEILLKDLFAYPSDPDFDELGSLELTGVFIDEFNQITEKCFNIVKSRIRHGLDENGLIPKILGTCNPSRSFVYKRFYQPYRDGTLPTERKFVQALLKDNADNVSKHYRTNLEGLDEQSRRRLLDGDWDYNSDPSALLEFEDIVNLFTNAYVIGTTKYITADIARLGKDSTVILVWEGFKVVKAFKLEKSRVNDTANVIRRIATEYSVQMSNVICDEDGVGGGVVDILRCKGFVNNSAPLPILVQGKEVKENYSNLKAQCAFKMAKKVQDGEVYVSGIDNRGVELLTEELQFWKRWKIDSDGKLSLMPKDEVKKKLGRSPDYSDAFLMRYYFELQPQRKAQGISSRII